MAYFEGYGPGFGTICAYLALGGSRARFGSILRFLSLNCAIFGLIWPRFGPMWAYLDHFEPISRVLGMDLGLFRWF